MIYRQNNKIQEFFVNLKLKSRAKKIGMVVAHIETRPQKNTANKKAEKRSHTRPYVTLPI